MSLETVNDVRKEVVRLCKSSGVLSPADQVDVETFAEIGKDFCRRKAVALIHDNEWGPVIYSSQSYGWSALVRQHQESLTLQDLSWFHSK